MATEPAARQAVCTGDATTLRILKFLSPEQATYQCRLAPTESSFNRLGSNSASLRPQFTGSSPAHLPQATSLPTQPVARKWPGAALNLQAIPRGRLETVTGARAQVF